MAEFRKWIYALAVVALLAGFTVPASAQTQPFACTISQSVVPVVRAEGYTELVGDIVLFCTGGTPTIAGRPIPQVNFTVFLNTNITSKITTNPVFNNPANFNQNFNEALLLVDDPNGRDIDGDPNNGILANPILNCGATGAPDTGQAGPGVCNNVSTGDPAQSYDGSPTTVDGGHAACASATGACNGYTSYPAVGVSSGVCATTVPGTGAAGPGGAGAPAGVAATRYYGSSSGYGCGRPNIFQGRMGLAQNPNQPNAVSFLGVPVDPPGTTTTRTFRITNIRANATIGVSAGFTPTVIQANVAINGPTTMTIANPQQIVAYVNRGIAEVLIPVLGKSGGGSGPRNRLDFVQCQDENPDLHRATTSNQTVNFQNPQYGGVQGSNTSVDRTPMVRFIEGFASSWKTRNVSHTIGDGATTPVGGNGTYSASLNAWFYNPGSRNNPADRAQNVPGAVYNTESGFMFTSLASQSSPNPREGFGFQAVTTTAANTPLGNAYDNPFGGITGGARTGISLSGVPSQGTRLSIQLNNVPSGASVWVPPVLYLYRQGSTYALSQFPNPTIASQPSGLTGVMVWVSAIGTPFSASAVPILQLVPSSGIATYEILYSDPFALEIVDIPTVVAYVSNPNQNLPTPNVTSTVAGGFSPNYTTTAASQPAPLSGQGGIGLPPNGLPIPRFVPGTNRLDLFLINKCACNLLFPYVVSAVGYDTGLAIANTSWDPGATFGFAGVQQPGNVTLWAYGEMQGGGQVAGQQTTTKALDSGKVLTYVLSQANTDYGLDNRWAGILRGYMIAQTQFQYCHAFAYIGAIGALPTSPGMSVGYLGIVLDAMSLNRTNQTSENKGH